MSYWTAGKRISTNAFAKYIQAGTESITFSSVDSYTKTVTFGIPFDSTPVVVPNINSGSGSTARWEARAISVSTTGFTLFVYANASGATANWSNVPVQWLAVSS